MTHPDRFPRALNAARDTFRLLSQGFTAGLPMPHSTYSGPNDYIELHMDDHGFAAWTEWATEVTTSESIHEGRVHRRAECRVGEVAFRLVYVTSPIVVTS